MILKSSLKFCKFTFKFAKCLFDLIKLILFLIQTFFLLFKASLAGIILYLLWLLQGFIAKADIIDDIINKTEQQNAFIQELSLQTMINEGFKLKAYKCPGGQWTICQGITRFKSKKQIKRRRCYLSGDKKTYWCFVKKKDVATAKKCDVYFSDYAEYLLKKINKNIANFNKMSKNKQMAIFDLLYYYGETAYNSKQLIETINEIEELKKEAQDKRLTNEEKNTREELFYLKQIELKQAVLNMKKTGHNFNTINRVNVDLKLLTQ